MKAKEIFVNRFLKKIYFDRSTYRVKLQGFYSKRQYHAVLGQRFILTVGIKNEKNATPEQIKKSYYSLIKQYHADNCHYDREKAKEYQQITKIIVSSYEKISKIQPIINQQTYYEAEDVVAMELYHKKFDEIKYWLYKDGNEEARRIFTKRLREKYPNDPKFREQTSKNYTNKKYYHDNHHYYHQSSTKQYQTSKNAIILIGSFFLAGGSLFLFGVYKFLFRNNEDFFEAFRSQSKLKIKEVNEEDIQNILAKTVKMKEEKGRKLINQLLKDQPPVLEYPKQDPHILDQLTDFSIAPDIHLYEVSPNNFIEEQTSNRINISDKQIAFPLRNIKPNTRMTLSLEAERIFQNIYIRVKDIIKQIEKTGCYKPPQVLFIFHGFIMAEIRQKPLSLKNYRDTEYISLFDLFFDVYSPIFFKRDRYCHYLVAKDEEDLFGWVHLNTRKTLPYYLKNQQKFVVMKYQKQISHLYRRIWIDFYRRYYDTTNTNFYCHLKRKLSPSQ